METTQP